MRFPQLLGNRVKRFARKCWLPGAGVDDLSYLADKFGSDKGTLFDAHQYTRVYKSLFDRIRENDIVFVEMGLLRVDVDERRPNNGSEGSTATSGLRAPSLEMWRTYFPRARLFGFDIDDFSSVHIDGCTIVRGDMSLVTDLARLVGTINNSLDIVIDDASHASHHQQIAFGYLFPHLRSGGMYIIEDLHWLDPTMEREGAPTTRDVLRKLQVAGAFRSPFLTSQQQRYIEANLARVMLFDSLSTKSDDATDALGIMIKK